MPDLIVNIPNPNPPKHSILDDVVQETEFHKVADPMLSEGYKLGYKMMQDSIKRGGDQARKDWHRNILIRVIAAFVLTGVLILWLASISRHDSQPTVKYEPNDPPSFHKKEPDGKQGKAGRHKVDPRARNVQSGEDK